MSTAALVGTAALVIGRAIFERHLRKSQAAFLGDTLHLQDNIIEILHEDEQRRCLDKLLSILMKGKAHDLVEQAIRYCEMMPAVRHNFVYNVTLLPVNQDLPCQYGPASRPLKWTLSRSRYVLMEARCDFRLQIDRRWFEEAGVSAGICFNSRQLDSAFRDPHCIYREQIHLEIDDQSFVEAALASFKGRSEAIRYFLESLKISVTCRVDDTDNLDLRYEYSFERGISVHVELPPETRRKLPETSAAAFLWKLKQPRCISQSHFPIVFNLPTQVSHVSFDPRQILRADGAHAPEIHAYCQFAMANSETFPDLKRPVTEDKTLYVNLNNAWVLPTSGIFVAWSATDVIDQTNSANHGRSLPHR